MELHFALAIAAQQLVRDTLVILDLVALVTSEDFACG